jgi:hypothetical protein
MGPRYLVACSSSRIPDVGLRVLLFDLRRRRTVTTRRQSQQSPDPIFRLLLRFLRFVNWMPLLHSPVDVVDSSTSV